MRGTPVRRHEVGVASKEMERNRHSKVDQIQLENERAVKLKMEPLTNGPWALEF